MYQNYYKPVGPAQEDFTTQEALRYLHYHYNERTKFFKNLIANFVLSNSAGALYQGIFFNS
jgi:hypothetical protein